MFTNWLENAPVKIFRPGPPDALTQQNLDRLYRFMMNHLVKVDMRNDPKPAAEVIALLEPLLQSWRTLAARGAAVPDKSAAPAQAAAPASAGPLRLSA